MRADSDMDIWREEYWSCGLPTDAERKAQAWHAVELHRWYRGGAFRGEEKRQRPWNAGRRGIIEDRAPDNASELRAAAEAEACRQFGITLESLPEHENAHARWFVLVALAHAKSDAPGSKRGKLGPKRAQYCIGATFVKGCWHEGELRETEPMMAMKAREFGETLTAKFVLDKPEKLVEDSQP